MLMDTWGFPIVWILSITLMNIGVRTYLLGTDFISIGLYAGFAFVLFRKHCVLLEKVTFCLGIPVWAQMNSKAKQNKMHLRLPGMCSLDSLSFLKLVSYWIWLISNVTVSSGRGALHIFMIFAVPGLCCADLSAVEASGAALLSWRAGFSLRWLLLWSTGSRAHRLNSRSPRALQHRPQSWGAVAFVAPRHVDLPGPGVKPVSPALAGGFFTTEPPGKPKRGS